METSFDITTIKLLRETKNRLDKLKTHKNESYNDAIERILAILNTCKINPEQARSKLKSIARARTINGLNKPSRRENVVTKIKK